MQRSDWPSISQMIDSADSVIVFLTDKATPQVKKELSYALTRNIPVIPIVASCVQCLLELDSSFPQYKLFRALSLRYNTVHIPQHVWNEIARHGRRRSQLQRLLKEYPFFKRCSVGDDYTAKLLYDRQTNPEAPLDRGEAEAIIQARERGISEVLIDERRGRKIALAHTLNPTGIVGLIREFRMNEVIPEAHRCSKNVDAMAFGCLTGKSKTYCARLANYLPLLPD